MSVPKVVIVEAVRTSIGAVGGGYAVGCTGARQVVDMVWQLARRDKKTGVTSRCVGGGMGSAELLVRM